MAQKPDDEPIKRLSCFTQQPVTQWTNNFTKWKFKFQPSSGTDFQTSQFFVHSLTKLFSNQNKCWSSIPFIHAKQPKQVKILQWSSKPKMSLLWWRNEKLTNSNSDRVASCSAHSKTSRVTHDWHAQTLTVLTAVIQLEENDNPFSCRQLASSKHWFTHIFLKKSQSQEKQWTHNFHQSTGGRGGATTITIQAAPIQKLLEPTSISSGQFLPQREAESQPPLLETKRLAKWVQFFSWYYFKKLYM